MFRLLALLLFVASVGFVPQAVATQNASQPARDAILVLDASGSMWARMDGKPQIVVAKDVVLGLLDDLSANYRLGLMAYGHRRKGDCSDIEMMVDVGGSRDAIRAAVEGISPKGKTPMTQAVIDAAEALQYTENKATVILVSDGKESCGMDPCAAARRLEELGVDLTVHAIGFGMKKGSEGLKQVQCLADNTGGQFFAADNARELTEALAQVSVAKPEPPAKVEVKLRATDQKGGPVIEQGLIWTVRNGATGKVVYQSAAPEGSVTVEMLRGVHDASVLRVSDEAGADGEIETGADGTTVTLPIIVKLKASLKAPDSAPAGSVIDIIWDGPGDHHDYVAVSAVDSDDDEEINYVRVTKGEEAELRLPDVPGDYELRYVHNQSDAVLARRPIEATEVEATLQAPATAAAGSVVDIQWTGPGYKHDFIAVSIAGSDDDEEINYVRVTKGEEAELRLPDAPGDYELRYILNQSREVLARRPIEATEVAATLEAPATAAAGSVVDITWTGPGYKHDFIAVSAAGSDDDEEINYVRVTKGEEAELRLPDAPGDYELRYILNQSREVLARRPITTTAISATLEAPATAAAGSVIDIHWTGPGYKHDYIAISAVGSDDDEEINYVRVTKGEEAELRLPDAPGDYELRYILNQSREVLARRPIEATEIKATLQAPNTAPAGSVVDIQWTGPGYKHDFIAISTAGADDDEEINYVRVTKGEEAKLRLPDAPGDYELRYILNQSREVLARRPIKTTAVTATLEAPATAPAGLVVDIQWTGPGYKHDYIAVSAVGSDDDEEINYVRVRPGEEAELRMPDAPGDYELRYVLNQSRKVLARRPIGVTPPKQLQRGVDRPGSDYRNFDVKGAGPKACLDACRDDSRCRAWAWTEPGFQSAGGMCWLKDKVPGAVPHESVVSGVVRE